jgi:hypothetical protein
MLDRNPPVGPDGMIQVTHQQHEEFLRLPVEVAEKEAALMLSHGMSPSMASQRISQGHAESARLRADMAARSAAMQAPAAPQQQQQQAAAAQQQAQPPGQPGSTQPPLATPGTPEAHEPPGLAALQRVMPGMAAQIRFNRQREADMTSGAGMTNIAVPFGIRRIR